MRPEDHVLVKLPNGASWVDEIEHRTFQTDEYELASGVRVKAEHITFIPVHTAMVECSARTPQEVHAWANHLRDFFDHYTKDRAAFGIWADCLYEEAFKIISGSMRVA